MVDLPQILIGGRGQLEPQTLLSKFTCTRENSVFRQGRIPWLV